MHNEQFDQVIDSEEIDINLLHHARLGLMRIHKRCGSGSTTNVAQTPEKTKEAVEIRKEPEPTTKASTPKSKSEYKDKKKSESEYMSLKKPVPRSIYYQHSKQGMKYWYEEKKPQSYTSKVPMGRKGMMLGLVDAPLK